MKVKILTSFPKKTIEADDVFISSDLHIGHQAVIDFGRDFKSLPEMNHHIVTEINRVVSKDSLLVLLGDTLMSEKDYTLFLDSLVCENVIMLYGNHCNVGKMLSVKSEKLIYQGYYLELNIDRQIFCCSHYPMFNWNHQNDGAISLHGHLHSDESNVVKKIHKYKSMDVGIDNHYKIFGDYSVFSVGQVKQLMEDKLIIDRH